MQIKYKIDKKLEYINLHDGVNLSYSVDNEGVLRGVDHLGRVLYVKQFNNTEELFQFLCGICHVLEMEVENAQN